MPEQTDQLELPRQVGTDLVLLHGDHVSAHDASPALRGKQEPRA
jgi:hypothetical protein